MRTSSFLSFIPTPLLLLGTVAVFGIVFSGCNNDSDALQEQVETLEGENTVLQEELAEARDEITDLERRVADETTVQLGDPIRFPSGSAWITDQGERTLDSLATILDDEYDSRDFHIRGFTDDRPIGPRLQSIYPSNWYLSATRAAAVAHYLDQEHGIRSRTLEIGAFGPQNPIASNETAEGRSLNRRVEIQVAE